MVFKSVEQLSMDNPVHVYLNGLNSARGFFLTRSVLKSLHHQLSLNFVGVKNVCGDYCWKAGVALRD